MTAAPKEPQVARVRPIPGEIGRFQVQSRSSPSEHHMVDLCENQGQGFCDCMRFSCYCGPLIKTTGKLLPRDRCAHIRAAREACLNAIISVHIKK